MCNCNFNCRDDNLCGLTCNKLLLCWRMSANAKRSSKSHNIWHIDARAYVRVNVVQMWCSENSSGNYFHGLSWYMYLVQVWSSTHGVCVGTFSKCSTDDCLVPLVFCLIFVWVLLVFGRRAISSTIVLCCIDIYSSTFKVPCKSVMYLSKDQVLHKSANDRGRDTKQLQQGIFPRKNNLPAEYVEL